MKTRLYKPEDYATIEPWWVSRHQPAVPANILPKCGVVVEEEGLLIAAAWIYQDNSVGVAWLAWLVSNPDVRAFDVEKALEVLLGGCELVIKEFGYGLMFTMTDRGSLGRWFQRNGFTPNHRGMTQYFKAL